MKTCKVCGDKLTGLQRKFCSKECKYKSHNIRHNNYIAQQKRGITRRARLIDLKGGKCNECGYSKCIAALCFHHVSSDDKLFKIDMRRCSNNSWDTLAKEAEKCILLCHNCHMELHYPQELSSLRKSGL